MASPTCPPIGIVAANSTGFVQEVLKQLAAGRVVVPLRDAEDRDRMALTGVSEVVEPASGFGWMKNTYVPNTSGETAQFLFTSGTEGMPKGVELSHAALADVVARLNGVMDVDGSIREYVGIPVYHSFGFGRCRAVAAVGGEAFLPENGFDPLEVAAMLRAGEINAISAVPSLWRVLLEARSMFEDIGEGIRWIEIGSQYMSREEKLAVRELFPKAKIVQHYGLTEASRSTFLEIHAVEGEHLESVGKGFGDVEVKLSDDSRIMIRGPHVTARIWTDGEAADPRDSEGWYLTHDLGSVKEGFVYFGGRADDVINCGGLKLSPEILENEVRAQLETPIEFAITRVPDTMRGDGILVAVVSADTALTKALADLTSKVAATHGVNARGAIKALAVDTLPKTASGKVQRRLLTTQYTERTTVPTPAPAAAKPVAAPAPSAAGPSKEAELQDIWQQALGIDEIGLDESFYDLGGDSLTALGVIMRMGRAGIDPKICRQIFQGATIRDLVRASAPEADTSAPAQTAAASPSNALAAREAELKDIWIQALGVDEIGLDESFYDLGGDSLTALGVIMRMGRAGIDPTICRQIFQGATIHELAKASLPAEASVADGAAAGADRQAELQEIWQQALGLDEIAVDESFYDLGGDSLTALGVIMRMSRAGIDPTICRQIFQGATIRDIADAAADASPAEGTADTAATPAPAAAAPKKATPNVGYTTNIMVNALRGILVVAVISGHWSVGLFQKLPAAFDPINRFFAPFFSFGTPGFAIAFGVGFAYLQLPIFERTPKRVYRSIKIGVGIVSAGIVILWGLQVATALWVDGRPLDGQTIFIPFYSALLFYAIALGVIPLWFKLVLAIRKSTPHAIGVFLGLAVASFLAQQGLDALLDDVKVTGFLQLVRLMLVAKFAYFEMMTGVFFGLALGVYIKNYGQRDDAPSMTGRVGLAIVIAALVGAVLVGDLENITKWPSPFSGTKWLFYMGTVTLLISGLMRVVRRFADLPPVARTALNAVSSIGQLSLPFYVIQSLVVPFKGMLVFLGAPAPLAFLVAGGAFFGGSYFLVKRVYTMFHG